MSKVRSNLRFPSLMAGTLVFAAACLWVGASSLSWYYTQGSLALTAGSSALRDVEIYFTAEALAISAALAGAYMIFRGLREEGRAPAPDSVRNILAESLSSRRDVRIGIVAGIAYGALYLFLSSIVVYQPSVDFASVYGVSTPELSGAVCCGSPGAVPALIVFLVPQAHVALQILPLDALFAFVVPLLVGANVAVAAHSMRNRSIRRNAGWLSSVGILAGLFTGCPTCAGIFLAGTLGGLGGTALAVSLAPYQMLFVVVSIPVLAASPFVMARYAARALRASCPVPGDGAQSIFP